MLFYGVDPDFDTTAISVLDDKVNTLTLHILQTESFEETIKAVSEFPWGEGILCVESQEIYPDSPVNPTDLMKLREITGAVKGSWYATMRPDALRTVLCPLPKTWKGTIKKAEKTKRIQKDLDQKSSEGLRVINPHLLTTTKLKSHVLDSVGLAFWGRGRHLLLH